MNQKKTTHDIIFFEHIIQTYLCFIKDIVLGIDYRLLNV
jgi:hypothetical protein